MKKVLLLTLLSLLATGVYGYNDHRGHNLDSLERAVAKWTPDAVDNAGDEELIHLNIAYRELMLGYKQISLEKSIFYARKALGISRPRGWKAADADALRYLGQFFYAREQYDSALVYYNASLAAVDAMAAGAVSPTDSKGYSEQLIDDYYSVLYGAVGNLYNEMGNIPVAMDYYAKAGAIFDKYGWNESNSVLWYNIGETWMDEGDNRKAKEAYDKSVGYAQAANDSTLLIVAYKGLGRLYTEEGQTRKALRYLHEVNAWYTVHPEDGPEFRRENLELIDMALTQQKKQLGWMLAGSVLVIVLLAGLLVVALRLRKTRHEKAEASELIEEVLQELPPQRSDIKLSRRERDILDLLSKGYTAPDIAGALGLSNDTIRWYRKKLIAKFDVANTAELISTAKDMGVI